MTGSDDRYGSSGGLTTLGALLLAALLLGGASLYRPLSQSSAEMSAKAPAGAIHYRAHASGPQAAYPGAIVPNLNKQARKDSAEFRETAREHTEIVGEAIRFFFAPGSSELPADSGPALVAVVKGVAMGQTVAVTPYYGGGASVPISHQLAQQRLRTVEDVLIGLGIGTDKIELHGPQRQSDHGTAHSGHVDLVLED